MIESLELNSKFIQNYLKPKNIEHIIIANIHIYKLVKMCKKKYSNFKIKINEIKCFLNRLIILLVNIMIK